MIFDIISSEYGWSTEYIFTRPISEIIWRLKKIDERKAKNFITRNDSARIKATNEDGNKELSYELKKKAQLLAEKKMKERMLLAKR